MAIVYACQTKGTGGYWRKIAITPTIIHLASPGPGGSKKVFLLGGSKSLIPLLTGHPLTRAENAPFLALNQTMRSNLE
jgi:hypothetical protein